MFPSSVPRSTGGAGGAVAHHLSQIAAPTVRCAIRLNAKRAVPGATGELDTATVPPLDSARCDPREVGFATLVVDLRGVTIIGPQGIQALLHWSSTAARSGQRFPLVAGSGRVRIVRVMTGLLEESDFDDVGCPA